MNSTIDTLSKAELEGLLKDLRAFRSLEKKLGKRAKAALDPQASKAVRAELSSGTPAEALAPLLAKLGIEPASVAVSVNPRFSGGARLFVGDDLYECSFNAISQKI